jgi:hypothetical protein
VAAPYTLCFHRVADGHVVITPTLPVSVTGLQNGDTSGTLDALKTCSTWVYAGAYLLFKDPNDKILFTSLRDNAADAPPPMPLKLPKEDADVRALLQLLEVFYWEGCCA